MEISCSPSYCVCQSIITSILHTHFTVYTKVKMAMLCPLVPGRLFMFVESPTLTPVWNGDKGRALSLFLAPLSLSWRILQKAAGLSVVQREERGWHKLCLSLNCRCTFSFILGLNDGNGKGSKCDFSLSAATQQRLNREANSNLKKTVVARLVCMHVGVWGAICEWELELMLAKALAHPHFKQ